MQLLDSSINILDSGVSDFPRLATVLQTTRVSRALASCILFLSIALSHRLGYLTTGIHDLT